MPQMRQVEVAAIDRSGAAIVFKGSGFYKTDYRSESYMKAAAADKTAGSAAAKTADGADDGKQKSKSDDGSKSHNNGKKREK